MTEREDTIERIERVLKLTHKESITVTIPRLTAERAVSMLKEQEPIKPKSKSRNGSTTLYQHFCGNCMGMLHGKPNYCPNCGRSVKWE